MIAVLSRSLEEPIRLIVNVPPRHGKTETLLHYIAWRLLNRPWEKIVYVTFNADLSKRKSRLARQYSVRAGLKLRDDAQALNVWLTPDMGGGIFTSIGGGLVGEGANVLIIDDPHKDRAEAESQAARDAVWDWYQGVARERLEPGGSIIVTHTRWHPDDLTGRLVELNAFENWTRINLKAIADVDEPDRTIGSPLWPERWPLEALEPLRLKSDYEWFSKYQGEPRGRGESVFNDVHFYDDLPKTYRVGLGIDMAYTKKTHSDWSVIIVMAESEGRFYVIDVKRVQVPAPQFARLLKTVKSSYPGSRMLWYASAIEKAIADLIRDQSGLPLTADIASAEKFIRAQPVAAAWNTGKVLLPRTGDALLKPEERDPERPLKAPAWVDELVSEICTFTGVEDRHDDQVDALAAAYDVLDRSSRMLLPRAFPTSFGKVQPARRRYEDWSKAPSDNEAQDRPKNGPRFNW